MSIVSCLSSLVSQGKITQQQADDARAIHDRILTSDMFRDMDQATREANAALRTAQILTDAAKAKRGELAMKTNRWIDNTSRIDAHPDNPMAGVRSLFDRDYRNRPLPNRVNATSLEREVYQPAIANKLHEFDQAYRSTMVGLKQDVNGIRNMIREVKGVATGDATAKAAAKGWTNATDYAASKAQQLGSGFKPDEEWKLPQFWEADRVRKFGDAEFKSDIQKEIDGAGLRVFDKDTKLPVSDPAARAKIIDGASRDIRMDLGRTAGPSTVFKTETRTFRFENNAAGAEAYLRLMDKYGTGEGNYYSMLQGHAESMAHELGMLHQFGPGFRSSTEQLVKYAEAKQAERGLEPAERARGQAWGDWAASFLESPHGVENLQKYMTGQLAGIEGKTLGAIENGARDLATMTKLGAATVTAVPGDTANALLASNFRGLDSGRLVGTIVHNLFGNNADRELLAARLGITAHAALNALGTKRFGDELIGSGAMQRLSSTVLRASGLMAWDRAYGTAFNMEFLASLADRSGKAFEELDKPFAQFLTDYGFTPEDWAKISAVEPFEVGGARFLQPSSIADDVLRTRLLSAIGDEKQFAYIAGGSNTVSALATGGTKKGTWAGMASRSFFLFKTFPISMLMTHGVRAVQEAANGRWGYAANTILFMTMAGAISMQAKQILYGKDPRNMADPLFWGAAFLQGGAAGIFGDFLKEGFSRDSADLLETIAGPQWSPLLSAQRLASSSYAEAVEGTKENWGSKLAKEIQQNTPGSGLWYGRLLFQRYLFDQLRAKMDPNYASSFRREQERQQRLYGQKFYWAPGETAPARGPDLGAALGGG